MEFIKVSFIIPVYNVEKYIHDCLKSLVNQSINCKEIIIVDDGSTDSSLEICKEYESKYNFIKVIEKENGGQSSARNIGILNARGKYIQFIDADDYIDTNTVEKMFELCEKNGLDMIRAKYHIYYEHNNQHMASNDLSSFKYINIPISSREYFIECINKNIYEVTPILGLFSKEFIINNNLFFSEGYTMEDHEFTLKCLTISKNSKVMQINDDFYTYRRRKNSTTTTAKIKNLKDIQNNYMLMRKYIDKSNFDDILEKNCNKCVSTLIYQATSIYGRLKDTDKKLARKIIPKETLKFCIKNSIDNHQKIKLILYKDYKFIVDLIYRIKLNNQNE